MTSCWTYEDITRAAEEEIRGASNFFAHWDNMAPTLPGLGKNGEPDQHLVALAKRDAHAALAFWRRLTGDEAKPDDEQRLRALIASAFDRQS